MKWCKNDLMDGMLRRNKSEKLTNVGIPMETFTGPDRTGPESGRGSRWSRDDDIGNMVASQDRTRRLKRKREGQSERGRETGESEERVTGRENDRRKRDAATTPVVQK